MSNLHQWIIVIQIVLNSSGGLSGGDDREHVHIKVHIPEVHRKHTHFRKIQKHHFHPKKVVKTPEYFESDLDTTPLAMLTYGLADHGHALQFPSYPMSLPSFPDIPTYGMDNTLEATIMKKPKMTSMQQMMSESMLTKFHGMKKPSEFMGAHPAEEIHGFSSPMDEDGVDDYDSRSTEAMILDQRVAGSSYPYSMAMSGFLKAKWPSYSNVFEPSMKPYSSGMKWPGSIPSDWMTASTEGDYSGYEGFHSPTTMHIAKTKPLSSSRLKLDQQSYERESYREPWISSKNKKSKAEKRSRRPSSPFRINY